MQIPDFLLDDTTEMRLLVLRRALRAKRSGLDGVVASPLETAAIRHERGPDFVIVTPGIRPAGAEKGDQERTDTPAAAIRAGADYLVIGRPITEAPDPVMAFEAIAEEITGAAEEGVRAHRLRADEPAESA